MTEKENPFVWMPKFIEAAKENNWIDEIGREDGVPKYKKTGFVLGDWLSTLSNKDLESLSKYADNAFSYMQAEEGEEPEWLAARTADLAGLAMHVNVAETGVNAVTEEDMAKLLKLLIITIVSEHAVRQGMFRRKGEARISGDGSKTMYMPIPDKEKLN